MDTTKLFEDYVFPSNMREMQRYYLLPTIMFLVLFSVILWVEAFSHSNLAIHLCVLVPWSLFILTQLMKQIWLNGFCYMRFQCTEHSISNRYKKEEKCLLFNAGFFVTTICVEFSIGKGRKELWFYAFSALPLLYEVFPNLGGLLAIKKLWEKNVLVIPITPQVESLLSQSLGVSQFAKYPKVSYFPSRQAKQG